ncbi:hypothetical protein ACO1NJ_14910, partial [Staphylococcus aureus]
RSYAPPSMAAAPFDEEAAAAIPWRKSRLRVDRALVRTVALAVAVHALILVGVAVASSVGIPDLRADATSAPEQVSAR